MFKTVQVGEAVVALFTLITVDVLVPALFNKIQPGANTLAVDGGFAQSELSYHPRTTKPSSFANPAKQDDVI
jgi:hypothetical protein